MPHLLTADERGRLPNPADVVITGLLRASAKRERKYLALAIMGWAVALWVTFLLCLPMVAHWMGR